MRQEHPREKLLKCVENVRMAVAISTYASLHEDHCGRPDLVNFMDGICQEEIDNLETAIRAEFPEPDSQEVQS